MKQLFASALLLLAPAWVMAQGSGAATPAKPASAKQATAAKVIAQLAAGGQADGKGHAVEGDDQLQFGGGGV